MSCNDIEQHLEAISEFRTSFLPFVNEVPAGGLEWRPSWKNSARQKENNSQAVFSLGIKNQVTVDSKITLQRLRMGIDELFYK